MVPENCKYEAEVAILQNMTSDLKKAVFGNGNAGLKAQVLEITQRISSCREQCTMKCASHKADLASCKDAGEHALLSHKSEAGRKFEEMEDKLNTALMGMRETVTTSAATTNTAIAATNAAIAATDKMVAKFDKRFWSLMLLMLALITGAYFK